MSVDTEQGQGAEPRPRPCASCPFRRSVPSGVWHPDEYSKLDRYDGEMHEQPIATFMCHQGDNHVCSGWLGYRDPADLLAVRLGISIGHLSPSCAEYTTDVPLFGSGREAAEHGMREVLWPGPEASAVIGKVARVRAQNGDPVTD
jgi:hypothetical protein